jgi:hypothetical protein
LRGIGLGCSVLAGCRFRKSAQFLQGVGLGLYRKEAGLGQLTSTFVLLIIPRLLRMRIILNGLDLSAP